MTTDFSRKRQVSGDKKAEAKGEPPYELEPDTAGPGLREWFHQLPKAKRGWRARWAASPCRRLRHSPRLRAFSKEDGWAIGDDGSGE
jgi:hypothetical protein